MARQRTNAGFKLAVRLRGDTGEDTVVANATTKKVKLINKIQKHFQNVMLVGMASEISKNYTYKCVDRSRHNGFKGVMT